MVLFMSVFVSQNMFKLKVVKYTYILYIHTFKVWHIKCHEIIFSVYYDLQITCMINYDIQTKNNL